MPESDTGDRTEAATPRRLQRAREEGQVPVSREAVTWAVLAAGGAALFLAAPAGMARSARTLSVLFDGADRMSVGEALRIAALAGLSAAAPFALAAAAAAIAAHVAQTGLLLTPSRLAPSLARIGPLSGFKRIFGIEGLVTALRSVAAVAATTAALWFALRGQARLLAGAEAWTLPALLAHLSAAIARVLLAVLGVQALIAGADLAWVRLQHARRLRMSRFDVKQDHKETEGDPRIKARIRQLRAARAKRRMLADVARATVVVTNPTHYAVALVYDRARAAAPRVVAKGVDAMAARIREAAAHNRVPIVANPPLARALHRLDLDDTIPPEHFQAVAQIIAYVWGLQRRAGP